MEKELEKQAMILGEDHSEKQLEKYDRLQNQFEAVGGYDYEEEMKSVFFHLGFEEKDLDKRLDEFSSGQQTRIALVKLLLGDDIPLSLKGTAVIKPMCQINYQSDDQQHQHNN